MLDPFIAGVQKDGLDFRGMLFPGLMITADGPKVLEFNCRFGDPETQVLLTRLESDLVDLLEATIDRRLDDVTAQWRDDVGGVRDHGLRRLSRQLRERQADPRPRSRAGRDSFSTPERSSKAAQFVTAGGRVLGVTALAGDLAAARAKAYAAVGGDRLRGRAVSARYCSEGAPRLASPHPMKFPVAPALAALLVSLPLACSAPRSRSQSQRPPAPRRSRSRPRRRSSIRSARPSSTMFIAQLKDHFIKPELLSDLEVKRATVQGLLERLAPGRRCSPTRRPAGASGPSPFRSEILDNRIGYARLGSTTPENIAALDAALAGFAEKQTPRARARPARHAGGQRVRAGRRGLPAFRAEGQGALHGQEAERETGEVLTSKDDPSLPRHRRGARRSRHARAPPRSIAAVLRTHVRAMVIGQQTRGEAVEFANLPLPGGKVLRVAVAEVTLPENAPVFPGGVKPDVPVDVPQETTDAVLKQGLESGVAGLVFETERPRMNEAALVAGIEPGTRRRAGRAARAKARSRSRRCATPCSSARWISSPRWRSTRSRSRENSARGAAPRRGSWHPRRGL